MRARQCGWIEAQWPAPPAVRAGATTREGGHSGGAFASFNLAMHVGDNQDDVMNNRELLRHELALPAAPVWLDQQHGDTVIHAAATVPAADAAYVDRPGVVCAVMTADCLPLLLCNTAGTEVAAVHVGWRGLCRGIIQNAVAAFTSPAESILAWIGPHICSSHYEVGDDVRQQFLQAYPAHAGTALSPVSEDRWLASLEFLSRSILNSCGVTGIYGCHRCNYAEDQYFYSFRRDRQTGRTANLIWLTAG